MDYISLPLTLREGYFSRTDLNESITQSVGLILSTRLGSIPFKPEYGCELWDREYADILTANKAEIRASLRNAIDKFERRLVNVSVSFGQGGDISPRRVGIVVKVTGDYKDDGEEKRFEATYGLD